jgi:hypothetical protein
LHDAAADSFRQPLRRSAAATSCFASCFRCGAMLHIAAAAKIDMKPAFMRADCAADYAMSFSLRQLFLLLSFTPLLTAAAFVIDFHTPLFSLFISFRFHFHFR